MKKITGTNSPALLAALRSIILLLVLSWFSIGVQATNIAVVGDSMSAEYYGDYDPTGFLASITESFSMNLTTSATDCSGGNYSSGIIAALLDAIMPLVPMVTNLPSRNWVQQLALHRGDEVDFGAITDDPDLYGEPRLRGHEFNFARVSGTVLKPGLGNHDIGIQIDQLLPYVANGTIDVVFMMIGSNDFAARELKQQSFCDSTWFDFQDEFIDTLFKEVDAILVTDDNIDVVIALLPLGTAAGIAEGIVLQRINETNARIIAEADAREVSTVDVWQFNQDPNRTDPTNGNLYIAEYSIPPDSIASIDNAVSSNTPGSGILGACTTVGKCGTLDTTLHYISTDGLHPGTVPQGFVANEIINALNTNFGLNINPLTDDEILLAGGTFIPSPGELNDTSRWVQIRQKGTNKCLELKSDYSNMTVSGCSTSKTRQRWYVIPFNGAYQIRSAYTVTGHTNGTCIVDDGWRFKVSQCSSASTHLFDIYGGDENRNWFIKATSRNACIYRHWLYEGGKTYGSLGNCELSWGWNYMRWGFYMQGTSAYSLNDVIQ